LNHPTFDRAGLLAWGIAMLTLLISVQLATGLVTARTDALFARPLPIAGPLLRRPLGDDGERSYRIGGDADPAHDAKSQALAGPWKPCGGVTGQPICPRKGRQVFRTNF
jgi:hypothetical protein